MSNSKIGITMILGSIVVAFSVILYELSQFFLDMSWAGKIFVLCGFLFFMGLTLNAENLEDDEEEENLIEKDKHEERKKARERHTAGNL